MRPISKISALLCVTTVMAGLITPALAGQASTSLGVSVTVSSPCRSEGEIVTGAKTSIGTGAIIWNRGESAACSALPMISAQAGSTDERSVAGNGLVEVRISNLQASTDGNGSGTAIRVVGRGIGSNNPGPQRVMLSY